MICRALCETFRAGVAVARVVEGLRQRGRGARAGVGERAAGGAVRCDAKPGVEIRLQEARVKKMNIYRHLWAGAEYMDRFVH